MRKSKIIFETEEQQEKKRQKIEKLSEELWELQKARRDHLIANEMLDGEEHKFINHYYEVILPESSRHEYMKVVEIRNHYVYGFHVHCINVRNASDNKTVQFHVGYIRHLTDILKLNATQITKKEFNFAVKNALKDASKFASKFLSESLK